MPSRRRPFFVALPFTLAALVSADYFYSNQFPGSPWITRVLLPAFAVELCFYLAASLDWTRNALSLFRSPHAQAALLWSTALIPYLILSAGTGTFHTTAFYLLVALTGIFSFWHVLLPRHVFSDLAFLIVAAAPILTRAFAKIYPSPSHHLRTDTLGHLMWIRVGIVALLVFREWDPGPFGLWPTLAEWRAGAIYFAASIVPLILFALAIHDMRYSAPSGAWWRVAGMALATFFGVLWVVALSEELFFRGVLLRSLLHHLPSRSLALVLSSLVFGSAHLWFHAFPDWRQASVAALLGLVLGLAYARSQSVRVPMVTHALVVTAWRLFFK